MCVLWERDGITIKGKLETRRSEEGERGGGDDPSALARGWRG